MSRKREPRIDRQLAAFGRNVRDARARAGLSQGKLCAGKPIDRSALSLLENAHRSPDLPTLLRVAGAIGVAPAELLLDVGSDGARPRVPRSGKRPNGPGQCLGANLRWARARAGLSQQAVAHKAGVDRAGISLYESGLREPNLRTVLRLAHALGLQPAVLLQDVG